jgi:hypothetical protein
VEDDAALVADFSNLGNRLNRPDLVVREHDADEDGLVVDRALEIVEIDQAIGLHRQIRDAITVLLETFAGVEHSLVLRDLGDDVVAALAIHLGNPLEREIVALGRA